MITNSFQMTVSYLEKLHLITCPSCPNGLGELKTEVYPRIDGCKRCTRVVGYDDALANTSKEEWAVQCWVKE